MDRNSIDWSGPMPALTTPFLESGEIDEDGFCRNIARLLDDGATGFLVGGCTGEFWALRHEERRRLFEIARGVVPKTATLLVGSGAVTVDETVALTRHAETIGCDGAVIVPPYFVMLTDDEIFAHFADVNEQIGIPVALYNIPGNAVNGLSPELVARLGTLDRIVAIKESSGDWNNYYATYLAVHESMRVFCGPSSLFGVPAVNLGADGTIDCFPNVWSPGGLDLYFKAKDGSEKEASELQEVGCALTALFVSEGRTLYPSTKAAMNILGLPGGGFARRPLRSLEGEALKGLERGLKKLGF